MKIRVIEQIALDIYTDYIPLSSVNTGYGNSQRAYRRIQNPLFNMVNGYSEDAWVEVPSIHASKEDHLHGSPCEFRSATIPQYLDSVYLRKVSFRVGTLRGSVFTDRSEDPRFCKMIREAIWAIVSYPQRPEYASMGVPSETHLRKGYTCLDMVLERHAEMESREDYTFHTSVCAAFVCDSTLTEINFPEGTGLCLDFSDIALIRYRWDNPVQMIVSEDVVLEVIYTLEGLFNEAVPPKDPIVGLVVGLSPLFLLLESSALPNRETLLKTSIRVPVKCRLVFGIIYNDDHTMETRLLLRDGATFKNGPDKIYEEFATVRVAKSSERSIHYPGREWGDQGPHWPGITLHQHEGHIMYQQQITLNTIVEKWDEIHVDVRVNNPHSTIIESHHKVIIYMEALEEGTMSEVFLDDPCDPGTYTMITSISCASNITSTAFEALEKEELM